MHLIRNILAAAILAGGNIAPAAEDLPNPSAEEIVRLARHSTAVNKHGMKGEIRKTYVLFGSVVPFHLDVFEKEMKKTIIELDKPRQS